MLSLIALIAFALPQEMSAADTHRGTAYHDAAARGWIEGARERSRTVDRSIESYTARVQERAWVGLRTLGRDRTLAAIRTAAQIEWDRRGPARVTVTGSAMTDPTGKSHVMSPKDRYPASFVYTPGQEPTVIQLSDSSWIRHPLARGSEQFYRFRTGPVTSLALPGGRTVRVVEVEVEPRRRDPRLLRGSMWLDADTRGVVRMVFQPAAPLRATIGGGVESSGGRRSINLGARVGRGGGWLGAGAAEAEIRYVTVEYGLHEGRWWMLRSFGIDGVAQGEALGLKAAIPVRWERAYSDYRVTASGDSPAGVQVAVADTASASHPGVSCPGSLEEGAACQCSAGTCRIVRVEVPSDTAALLASAELPPRFAEAGARMLSGTDTEELTALARSRIPAVWALETPVVGLTVPNLETLRYNRVEGLSVGAGVAADFGSLRADLFARIGTADREPNAELGLSRTEGGTVVRLAGYRRLAAVDPAARPFSAGNSLSALLWGSDNGEYFRADGIELLGEPAATEKPWYAWRIFAEQQWEADRRSDFFVRNAIGGGDRFRPNIDADRADQAGASVVLRAARGRDPGEAHAGAELFLEGSTGSYDFARPRLSLSGGVPLPRPLWGTLEVGAGTSFGPVPTQSLWYLGGPATLRGYDGNAARGEAFWRARGELATGTPVLRLGVFSDAGWAGNREGFGDGRPLVSVGAGAGLLDGWLRMDLARALVAPIGWRLTLTVDPAR